MHLLTSRLDYCNALLAGCPASSINKLQVVQNVVARVLTRSRKYDHITPILQSLHWLPIKFRISYKILFLAYKALNGLAAAYLISRGVTRHLSHETRRDTRLGSRERDETRFLAFFFLILDEMHRENTKCKKCRCILKSTYTLWN